MRTLMIAQRVIKELLRDKRTLALMFLAPVLILFLMKLVFSVNSQTDVNVATVNVSTSLNESLNKDSHVSIIKYNQNKQALRALEDKKVDAAINYHDNNFYVKYSNVDASKTNATKLALNNALLLNSTKRMKQQLQKLQSTLGIPVNKVMSSSKPKIYNSYVYGNSKTNFFDKIVPILMGFFVFFFVFLISGMALLNERTSGTLSRLLATPVKRSEIVFGYMLSYGVIAILQTLVIVLFTVWALNVEVVGSIFYVILINFVLALVALAFGILMSTFAKSEFQMMQFIPLVVIPQIFFSGIIPLDTMAKGVRVISYILPLKYAGDALTGIVMSGDGFEQIVIPIVVLLGFLIILTVLNILGLKKYRKV
ncbi:ABC transporter permease [Companilactobacillus kimchii]|uniref:DrrB family ABC transporter efflux protein n=2 Tax=Companilactobacillus kimchii TaxID=2801452 RepID=A0ABR5NT05_9LACO|nr:ABC transporter permease [Companilactobacillus kimchii]KAE9562088.1 antibiotic ABC transporter permease [Companilactobacillus kimchii]KRK51298.1 DrrB family ABC transporter efflux protein [Companilactobacillus kimchii DSM 13961 = JCM 10707]OWF34221.1 Inner membrane transport permease [Companilactobacillus kimchii]GEO46134.1 antibiotic ABC transporter permease [Companilactobacillus paralimentarius]